MAACFVRRPNLTSTRKARPRFPTTVPVMPWKRLCGHPFWTLESMRIVTCAPTSNVWKDRVMGESPRSRGLRRYFCRVFSMIPFEAFTIVSSVQDVEDVQLEDLAHDPEPFREGRDRPASVSVDPLLHVGPRLRRHVNLREIAVDPGDVRRQEPSMPRGIRAPLNDPFGGALGDRLGHQYREGPFKLCFLHRRRRADEDAVPLRRAVFLDRDHVLAARGLEPVDLRDPRGIDPADRRREGKKARSRLLDLDDEGPAAAEHPRVDVLSAHPVEGVTRSSRLPHDLPGDHPP